MADDDRVLDPEVAAWIASLAVAAEQATLSVADLRAASEGWPVTPGPEMYAVVDHEVDAGGHTLRVRTYRPTDAAHALPALVFFHGGGWVAGSIELVDGLCRHLATDAGCVVVNAEYRLAPEHPYPAATDDALAVVRWVRTRCLDLRIDPERVAVAGESAGGNIAACVAIRIRDECDPPLVHQTLIYPVLDHDFGRASMVENAEGYGLTRETMMWCWDCYAPDHSLRDQPTLAPVRAADLAGLPSATVVTAGFDPLCDEGDEYAGRLAEAGVAVTHLRYAGAIHGFVSMADSFASGRAARDAIGERLRTALHPPAC